MNINEKFNSVFRKIPEIYNKRKAYHKSFRYMSKNEKRDLTDIYLLLWNMRNFDSDKMQLKAIFKRLYSVTKCAMPYYKSITIFLQSILSDMESIPDVHIKKESVQYILDILNSFKDVPSLYPTIIKPEFLFNKTLENSSKKSYISIKC